MSRKKQTQPINQQDDKPGTNTFSPLYVQRTSCTFPKLENKFIVLFRQQRPRPLRRRGQGRPGGGPHHPPSPGAPCVRAAAGAASEQGRGGVKQPLHLDLHQEGTNSSSLYRVRDKYIQLLSHSSYMYVMLGPGGPSDQARSFVW